MNYKLCLCILITLAVNFVHAQNKIDLKFKHYTVDDSLSVNAITSILQDNRGLMWFGTNNGLNKFDGFNFTKYFNNPNDSLSLTSNFITSLSEDSKGNLWIGTNNGICKFNRDYNNFIHYKINKDTPIAEDVHVANLLVDKSDILWIASNHSGFYKLIEPYSNKEGYKIVKYTHNPDDTTSISTNSTRFLAEAKNGDIWIGGRDKLIDLNRFDREKEIFVRYRGHAKTNISNTIFSVHVDKADNLWVGTWGSGLNCLNKKTNTFSHYINDPQNTSSLSHNIVLFILEDLPDSYWVGTRGGGLNKYFAKSNHFVNYKEDAYNINSLNDNFVTSIYKDRSGVLWIGTTNGGINVTNLNSKKFRSYKTQTNSFNSLNCNSVSSFIETKEGLIWIGTKGGGISLFDKKKNIFTSFVNDPDNLKSLSYDIINVLFEDSRGKLWIGTDGKGICRLDKESLKGNKIEKLQFTNFKKNSKDLTSIANNTVCAFCEDKFGFLWIGTYGGGISKYNPENETFVNFIIDHENPTLIENNSVVTIVKDKNEDIWFGSRVVGLRKFTPVSDPQKLPKLTHFRNNPNDTTSIIGDAINSIFESKDGSLWIGTDNGFSKLIIEVSKNDDSSIVRFENYTTKNGMSNNFVNGIVEDNKGNLWLSTNKDLCKFNPSSKKFANYSRVDGLLNTSFSSNACMMDKEGDIYFGGPSGIEIFNPDSIYDNKFIPNVIISDFKISNKSVKVGEKINGNVILNKAITESKHIVLSYKESVISFEFAALHYANPSENKYAYILEGFDNEDSDWTYVNANRNVASYTNLNPGEYTFKVKGSNSDDVWNEIGVSLKITITPPFWKTWWFRSLIVGLILIMTVGFYLWRVNSLERQKRILELKVNRRTEQLQEANTILEEGKEEIFQQNEELELQKEKLESKNTELQSKNAKIKEQNENIKGSIRYAQTIQQSILPPKTQIDKILENFIIFLPKDIVSGDFYWFTSVQPNGQANIDSSSLLHFVATVDCTGHGVPGAFMSMIGSRMLNEIVNEKNEYEPCEILRLLNLGIRKALRQDETDNDDGMDVCLVRIKNEVQKDKGNDISTENKKLQTTEVVFCGAKRPLYHYNLKKKELHTIKGNINTIGGKHFQNDRPYENYIFSPNKGDTIYLSSDGYIDQQNNKRKRLSATKFMNTIVEAASLPATEQYEIFSQKLKDHMQGELQRDDIAVIGIKF